MDVTTSPLLESPAAGVPASDCLTDEPALTAGPPALWMSSATNQSLTVAQSGGEGRDGSDEHERRHRCPPQCWEGYPEPSGPVILLLVEQIARGVSDVRHRRVMDQGPKLPQLSRVRVLYPASLSFAISARRLLSARESRDLTVPRAQPRIAAVSSSESLRK